MPSWRDEYLSSVKDADLSHPVNMELVQACSQMADRIAALEAEKASLQASVTQSSAAAGTGAPSVDTGTSDDAVTAALRVDLAEALRSKGVSETRLRNAEEELDKLRARAKSEGRMIRELTSDRTSLITRLKDRDHELREKRKLLENVQDEMIALSLQVEMAEKKKEKVQQENKELIARWMKRMGEEADAMNLHNER